MDAHMTRTPFELPQDLSKLRRPRNRAMAEAIIAALVDSLEATRAEVRAQAQVFQETIEQLRAERDQLQRRLQEIDANYRAFCFRFYRIRERFTPAPGQLPLMFPEDPELQAELEAAARETEKTQEIVVRRRVGKRRRGWEQIASHLERQEIEVEPRPEDMHCPEHGERECIGYDETMTIHMTPPKFWVEVRKYPKYVCPHHEECGVHQPPRRAGLVEGDRYGPSVGAQVVTAKYAYHLPLYRQQDMYAAYGWTPRRSTLERIGSGVAEVVRPVAACCLAEVLASGVIGCDDTPCRLIVPATLPAVTESARSRRTYEVLAEAQAQQRRSILARMWIYRSFVVPVVAYDFTVSRHREGPADILARYQGYLMGDCWSGYGRIVLEADGRITLCACWAHARRHIYHSYQAFPGHAALLLRWVQMLYDVEDEAREMTPEARLALRQARAVRVLGQIKDYIQGDGVANVLPRSSLGQALNYLRNHWAELLAYTQDGRVPIDNNGTERDARPVAVGRNNWLFFQSVRGGEEAAILMTLIHSAQLNSLDTYAYMTDVLEQLLAGNTDYRSLCPHVWVKSHPEAVRQYRVEESRAALERKALRRARRRLGLRAPPDTS